MKDKAMAQKYLSQSDIISLLLNLQKLYRDFPTIEVEKELLQVARLAAIDQERRVNELFA